MHYPYFVVQRQVGRLECPPQYRHTPIERQFKSGRIGGTRALERIYHTAIETHRAVVNDRGGSNIHVFVVLRPHSPRQPVHNCETLVWTISGRHITLNEVDNELSDSDLGTS